MPDLNFEVLGAEPITQAESPHLAFKLRLTNAIADEPIHTITLRCQIRIEPTRRHYSPGEQEQLADLFGEPERWSHTLRSALWTHAQTNVPAFDEEVEVDLPVPCTYDFNVAATKYFHALEDGQVPLQLLFSGTIFYVGPSAMLQVAQIPWEKEAPFSLPVRVWREMMEHYYPNTAWLCLRKDVFEQLYRYKIEQGLPTWEQVLEQLLQKSGPTIGDNS